MPFYLTENSFYAEQSKPLLHIYRQILECRYHFLIVLSVQYSLERDHLVINGLVRIVQLNSNIDWN